MQHERVANAAMHIHVGRQVFAAMPGNPWFAAEINGYNVLRWMLGDWPGFHIRPIALATATVCVLSVVLFRIEPLKANVWIVFGSHAGNYTGA